MDQQPRIPTIKNVNGTWFSSKTQSYLQDGLTIKDAYRHLILIQKLSPTYRMDKRSKMPIGTSPLSKTKSYQQDGPTIKDAYGHLFLIQN